MNREMTAQIAAELAAIAKRLRDSTVKISGSRGGGSGVLWRDGLIVTNAHVVRRGQVDVALANGQVLKAQVGSQDPSRDLAALHVEATVPAVTVGDSRTLRPGELVLAIGNPFGAPGVLTTGIVYASTRRLGRVARRWGRYDHPSRRTEAHLQDWLPADIRLSPGNSGGPLATAQGHVVGINTMVADGLALAVPSHEVERFLHQDR